MIVLAMTGKRQNGKEEWMCKVCPVDNRMISCTHQVFLLLQTNEPQVLEPLFVSNLHNLNLGW